MTPRNFVRLCVLMCGGLPLVQAAEQAPLHPFPPYQAWQEAPLADWRAANDRVGAIGGWRTYLREAQPDAGNSHDHGAPPPSAPGGHGHHGHQHPGH